MDTSLHLGLHDEDVLLVGVRGCRGFLSRRRDVEVEAHGDVERLRDL